MVDNAVHLTRATLNWPLPFAPGPQQEISIWGDKVEDLVFWVPNRTPVGVGVSFFSYMGVVKVGLNVDLALVDSKVEVSGRKGNLHPTLLMTRVRWFLNFLIDLPSETFQGITVTPVLNFVLVKFALRFKSI